MWSLGGGWSRAHDKLKELGWIEHAEKKDTVVLYPLTKPDQLNSIGEVVMEHFESKLIIIASLATIMVLVFSNMISTGGHSSAIWWSGYLYSI